MTVATEVRERPILFSGPMVRAILDGRKTQTRRVVKPQPDVSEGYGGCTRLMFKKRNGEALLNEALNAPSPLLYPLLCPYGDVGDRLWVRETFATGPKGHGWGDVIYHATFGAALKPVCEGFTKWKPSIHMPRAISRLSLDITEVRVERLQDITNVEAEREGVTHYDCGHPDCFDKQGHPGKHFGPRGAFMELWESLNAKRGYGWDANPWVWCLTFRRHRSGGSR